MNTTIKLNQEEINNFIIENNFASQDELNAIETMYRNMSHEKIIERLEHNMLLQRVSMIEWQTAQIGFQLEMDRMNRTLDKINS